MRRETVGGLPCLVDRRGSGAAACLLHGYGAGMGDLAPLAPLLGDFDWHFPDAPLPAGPGAPGRAWIPLDQALFQECLARDDFSAMVTPDSLRHARRAVDLVAALLDELASRHDRVLLGGFSQGAEVALKAALTRGGVDGLAVLSGLFVSEELWSGHRGRRLPMATFQSHGTRDAVVPFSEGERLRDLLLSINPGHEFHAFDGGHEVPGQVVGALAAFLSGRT